MSPIGIGRPAPVASVRAANGQTEAGHRPQHAGAQQPDEQLSCRIELADTAALLQPPVDHDRVDQIRAALRDGTYPIVPAKIVDALIAARLSLGGEA